jgi:hypothetical protein
VIPRVPGARELSIWRRCAFNGASARTLEVVSRLPPSQLRRYVFCDGAPPVHRGRNAYRDVMSFQADSARAKLELSVFGARYQLGRQSQIDPLESLVHAFERGSALFVQPLLKFDQCFMAVSHLEGMWLADRPTLRLVGCRSCGAPVLASRLETFVPSCPVCAWRAELRADPRAGLKHPTQAIPASAIDGVLASRHAEKDLLIERIASHTVDRRVVAQLLDASPFRDLMDDGQRLSASRRSRRALRIERLGENVSTVDQLQYSLALSAYQRMTREKVPPHEAALRSHAFLRDEFRFLKSLPFERVFDFIRQLDGNTWGVPTRLRLDACPSCQRDFVVSIVDQAAPVCPFCRLSRRPNSYLKQRWVAPKHPDLESNTRHLSGSRATFLG